MYSWFVCLVLLCLASLDVQAQNRWIVGPGGLPSIHAAYLRAAPGDTILVRIPTDIVDTLSGKGVNIIGDGVTPTIQTLQRYTSCYPRWESFIENVPARQVLYLENLRFEGALRLRGSDGGIVLNRIEARRSTHDGFECWLKVYACRDVIAMNCLFSGNADLRPGCPGRSVGCAAVSSEGTLTLAESGLQEGPTGVFECYWPDGRQYLYGFELLVLSASVPGVRLDVNLIRCGLRGSHSIRISADRVDLSLSAVGGGVQISGSQARVAGYGVPVALVGPGSVANWPRRLPEFDARLGSTSLDLSGTESEPLALIYLGFSLRPSLVAFESLGHHGMLTMDLDRSRSALLDVVSADSRGAWARSCPVAPAVRSALRDQVFLLQGLEIDSVGRIWCSSPGAVRF